MPNLENLMNVKIHKEFKGIKLTFGNKGDGDIWKIQNVHTYQERNPKTLVAVKRFGAIVQLEAMKGNVYYYEGYDGPNGLLGGLKSLSTRTLMLEAVRGDIKKYRNKS